MQTEFTPIPSAQTQASQWYAVFTMSGMERDIAVQLRRIIGVEVYIPETRSRPVDAVSKAAPLLFDTYVFVRCGMSRELADQINEVEGVRWIVGTTQSSPSMIEEWQVNMVKEICSMERHPSLGPMPQRGRTVRIVSGPLKGGTGVIVENMGKNARVAFSMPLLSQTCRLVAPWDILKVVQESEAQLADSRPRHRSGRRTRRGQTPKDHARRTDA